MLSFIKTLQLYQYIYIAQPKLLYLGISFQRQLEEGNSFKRLANPHSHYTQIMVGIRVARLCLQDGTIKALSILELAFFVCRNALLQRLVYG